MFRRLRSCSLILFALLGLLLASTPIPANAHELNFVPDPTNSAHYPSAYDPDGDGVLEAPTIQYTLERFSQASAINQRLLQMLAYTISVVRDNPAVNCQTYLKQIEYITLAPIFASVPSLDVAAVHQYETEDATVLDRNQPLVNACKGEQVITHHMIDNALSGINSSQQYGSNLDSHIDERTGQVVGNGTPASCTQAALQAVVSKGGRISFNCGGDIVIPINSRIMMTKDTIIDGGNQVTLDGQRRSAIIGSNERLTVGLKNIRIVNGQSAEQGAGFNVGFWSNLTIENVTFDNNASSAEQAICDGGGALFIGGGSVATINSSTFTNNRANNGGAINNLRTKLTINHTIFKNNSAMHTARMAAFGDCGGGGAIYFDGTRKPEDGGPDPVVWSNVRFVDNTTNNHGGAVFYGIRSNERVQIVDTLFQNNKAMRVAGREQSGTGGALWLGPGVGGQTGYNFQMERVAFIGNHADYQGGGFWTRSDSQLTNVTFEGNSAINPAVSDRTNWRRGLGGGLATADRAEVFLFRLAYANEPEVRSLRRPLEDVLIKR